MIVLAIDQGTSGTKAIVVDGAGEVLATAEESVRPVYLDGGGVEQEPNELLNSVLVAGRRAIESAGVRPDHVALANQGETVLAWNPATGQPLSQAIVWQDRRSEQLCVDRAEYADVIAARTGLVLDSYFSAPKMAWLRDNVTREGIVTTTDSWIVHHLTGELVTDVSTASRSLLLDIDTVTWDPELLAIFNLDDEVMPRLVPCDETVGSTAAFGGEATVTGLIVDQQAALFAEACLSAGDAKCTYGTGAFLLANTGEHAVRSAHGLTSSIAWTVRGRTDRCLDGQVYTAASAFRWLADLGVLSEASALDGECADESGGVYFVPGLAGLAAPWWESAACGALAGMGLATSRGHVVRAVVEGIAAQVAELARVIARDLGHPLTHLRVDGGLTRSTVLMQAQADLLQIPIEVYPSPHATALGAAALSRLAADSSLSPIDAVSHWTPLAVIEPRWSADRAAEFLGQWRAVVDAARGLA